MFKVSNIASIVEDFMPAIIAEVGFPVFFDLGHYLEIVRKLTNKSADPAKPQRYPLLWLLLDIEEQVSPRLGIYAQTSPVIIIAQETNMHYTAQERLEYVFIPVLYPIYEALMNQILLSPDLANPYRSHIGHTKIDRFYWDGAKNVFNDYVDAIEIRGLELFVKNKICSPFQLN